jgi:glycosyltransferase involved in cell wall biosynthesis
MPLVSVVIPAFNARATLAAAVASVHDQAFQNYEIIVVDDGSPEPLEAWLPASSRLTYVRQDNGGPGKARNTGIRLARGELIAFLDADDTWLPDKLAQQVAYFERYPETGLLHSAALFDDATPVDGSRREPDAPRSVFCELFHNTFEINTPTVMIPARVLADVGGFDERREVHVEDWDLWIRVAARYPIGYLPAPLAVHRRGGLMSTALARTFEGRRRVIEKDFPLCAGACPRHREDADACRRRSWHALHREYGYELMRAGDVVSAREQFRQAAAIAPLDFRGRCYYALSYLKTSWVARLRKAKHRLRSASPAAGSFGRAAARADAAPDQRLAHRSPRHDSENPTADVIEFAATRQQRRGI